MTSNAGSSQKGGSVGFGRSLTEQSKEKGHEGAAGVPAA